MRRVLTKVNIFFIIVCMCVRRVSNDHVQTPKTPLFRQEIARKSLIFQLK